MHLFWKDNALFIKKKKFLFDKNIKKAFIFDDTPTVLTDTIIFIDEFPYSFYCKSIPIFENSKMYLSNLINDNYERIETCHLNNFLYYKSENKIFLLQHKLSNPEFLFSCRLDFLEVTDNYFLLGREDKMYLKKKHFDLTLEIIFTESMISFKSVCFDEINNDPHKYSGMFYLKINNFLIFYAETKVFFLNEKNLEFKFLKMNLKRVEIAKLNNKEYLLLNDNLFDGFDLIKCGVSVDKILSLTHFGLTGENVCQNFVKIKQSEDEIFEKRLAKSPSPYNFIKKNIKNLTDFEYAKKIKEYYLNNEEKESQENKIEKIISPADLQDYLFNFDPNIVVNIRANDTSLSKNGVIKNDLNFYDIFNKNLNQNENLTSTNTLKKFYSIKSNLQIRQKIFNEPPNINYLKKISSLTLENLDSKTKEALNLCFEPVKSYVPDENDFENKKLKFFKIKKQAQSPFILYSSLKPSFLINGFNNAIVRTLMTDYNDYIGMINEDNKGGICLTNTIKQEMEESEIYKIINNYLLEKKEYTSEEIGGLILGLGIRKTYHKILNTEIDFINAMSLIASSLTNEGKKDSSLLNNLKVKNLTINVGTVISLGYSFKNTNNSLIIDLLIKECNKYGSVNKHWYDEIYRLISGYSLILLHKKRYLNDLFLNYKINHFIKLDDKLVEVIVNGILFWNTKDNKILKKLKRNTNDRLEEIFYSEFFTLGVLNKKIKVPSLEKGLNLQEIYRLAGKLFYLGVYCFMNDEQNEEIYKKLKKECLMVEQEMLINREYKILYDTLLVILCLIYNGTCDLKILKILRRSLNLTTNLRLNDFIFGKFETNYFLRYGDFLRYKMCTGLLFCGLGRFNLKKDCLVDLIYAFYINFPLTEEDQKLFTFFRHNLASKFELKPNLIISDWSKEDKKILFDLFGWYYEELGEVGLPLSTFMS